MKQTKVKPMTEFEYRANSGMNLIIKSSDNVIFNCYFTYPDGAVQLCYANTTIDMAETYGEEHEEIIRVIKAHLKTLRRQASKKTEKTIKSLGIELGTIKGNYPLRLNASVIIALQNAKASQGIVICNFVDEAIVEKLIKDGLLTDQNE